MVYNKITNSSGVFYFLISHYFINTFFLFRVFLFGVIWLFWFLLLLPIAFVDVAWRHRPWVCIRGACCLAWRVCGSGRFRRNVQGYRISQPICLFAILTFLERLLSVKECLRFRFIFFKWSIRTIKNNNKINLFIYLIIYYFSWRRFVYKSLILRTIFEISKNKNK